MRVCTLCEQKLPLTQFIKRHRNKDGRGSVCTKCANARSVRRNEAKRATAVIPAEKTCQKCLATKSADGFHNLYGGLDAWCKLCRRAWRLKVSRHKQQRRTEQGGCVDCGLFDLRIMYQQHRDPADASTRNKPSAKASEDAYDRELAKCEPRCAFHGRQLYTLRRQKNGPPIWFTMPTIANATTVAAWKRRRVYDLKVERGGCQYCGRRLSRVDPHHVSSAFDWHHAHGAIKVFDLAGATNHPRVAIDPEVAKCYLLCANCHAIVTSQERQDINSRPEEPQYFGDPRIRPADHPLPPPPPPLAPRE